MSGPPARPQTIEIVPYDPAWPAMFEAERALIAQVFGRWITGTIEHIGSTAVPGLAAKAVIDIMAPVRSLADAAGAIAAAPQAGYLHYPYQAASMHWFCKPSPHFRTHHLHLVPLGSELWRERLAFRDALRASSDLAAGYAALKRQLAAATPTDREAYTDAKGPFVQQVLRGASGQAQAPSR